MLKIVKAPVLLALLFLTGCASNTTAPVYLLLNESAPVQSENVSLQPVSNKTVRVTVADYLRQPQLAISVGNGKVQFSDNYYWAEPLDKAIKYVLRQQLEQVAPGKLLSVEVDVQRLNIFSSGTVEISGEIRVDRGNGFVGQRFRLMRENAFTDYSDVAGVVPDMFGELAWVLNRHLSSGCD
ncbi:PqiC family protein [Sansalvadorimonas verongulae]|uniref:PqiC family protein n=1 Tax=Sansalvadorimonas verongulae TaxID=2172824 RepID=UPI0012BBE5EB|nr:ABC-type transport auxiliary lipoprotein family protein [Sansalvadorimonas verongulae]MTI14473.1 hypothetical protein [Sansalvadorimonas verongulae]